MSTEDLYQDDVENLDDDDYAADDASDQAYAEPAQHWPEPTANEYAESAAEQPDTQAFASLALDLTLRCGALKLTLGDLRRLGAGSILEVSGIAPGQATLCHGEQVVAEGELVDVDGRLGLQITRLAAQP